MPEKYYITVILPLRLEWEPFYWCADPVNIGDRVCVVFANKRLIGVVSSCKSAPDIDPSRIHQVQSCETGLAPVSGSELDFWRFVADYYMCTVGEVYKAAYPATKTNSEQTGAKALQRRRILEEKTIELWCVRIKRLKLRLQSKENDLAGKHNAAVRLRLEEQKKDILRQICEAEARLAEIGNPSAFKTTDYSRIVASLSHLSPDERLGKALDCRKPVLHKCTSGPESYAGLIADQLRRGKNVLILLNESDLADRLYKEFLGTFGDLMLLYNYRRSRSEQRSITGALRSGRQYVLVGTRSAIFLPFNELGLIIVANEESVFYKQTDSNPRYNTRDCAVQLSRIHDCSIVLSTYSPSLESIYNCKTGRYVFLDDTVASPVCRKTIIDMTAEKKKNGIEGVFSLKALHAIRACKGRVAIIRGFEKETDFEGLGHEVFSIPQASSADLRGFDLIVMTSADALFNREDFRSDEHAFQFLERVCSICHDVVIQTTQPGHQVFSISSADVLIKERRSFRLPPFTRLVDIRTPKAGALYPELQTSGFACTLNGGTVRITLQRDRALADNKRKLYQILTETARKGISGVITDVDPQ